MDIEQLALFNLSQGGLVSNNPHAQCQQDGCRFGSRPSHNFLAVEAARKHGKRHGHLVFVFDHGVLFWKYTPPAPVYLGDDPPY